MKDFKLCNSGIKKVKEKRTSFKDSYITPGSTDVIYLPLTSNYCSTCFKFCKKKTYAKSHVSRWYVTTMLIFKLHLMANVE